MKDIIINSTMFGIILCVGTYSIGQAMKAKFKTSLANPLFIAICLTIATLAIFDIEYDTYYKGGMYVSMLLTPATCTLGLSIYRKLEVLKANFFPIIIGSSVGAIVSVLCSVLLCKAFGLDEVMIATMLPRAATSPIAMEISQIKGGMVSVTVAMVIFSGVMGAVFAPILVKLLKLKNKVAIGVAIGTSSSAAGTTKAIEMGEIEGAMSGIAVGITGIATVLVCLFI